MRYAVFVTDVNEQVWTSQQAENVYRVRWQIEMIFKSWKSGAGLDTILHEKVACAKRVKTVLNLFLLFLFFRQQVINIHDDRILRYSLPNTQITGFFPIEVSQR